MRKIIEKKIFSFLTACSLITGTIMSSPVEVIAQDTPTTTIRVHMTLDGEEYTGTDFHVLVKTLDTDEVIGETSTFVNGTGEIEVPYDTLTRTAVKVVQEGDPDDAINYDSATINRIINTNGTVVPYEPELMETVVISPTIFGSAENEFVAYLEGLGLEVGTRTEVYNSTYPAGTIITCDTENLYAGDKVNYTVSLGAEPHNEETHGGSSKVEVVNYAGMPEEQFLEAIEQLGMTVGNRSVSYSETVAEGNIITNTTGELDSGSTIDYTVSLGAELVPQTITIPSSIGSSEIDFLKQLENLGLQAGTRTEAYSSLIPLGSIINYETGEFQAGDSVDYTVSLGAETQEPEPLPNVNLADYTGKTEPELLSALESLGLVAGTRSEEYSNNYVAGTIISHQTGEFEAGSAINYTVSLGAEPAPEPEPEPEPQKISIPATLGAYEIEFINLLSQLGLVPGVRSEGYNSIFPVGTIIDYTAGEFDAGDSVDYTVSLGAEPPVVDTQALQQAYDNLVAANARLEAAQAQVNKGSVGYFEKRNAQNAIAIIDWAVANPTANGGSEAGKTVVGDPQDATSLENMKASFDYIREGNTLRKNDNNFSSNGELTDLLVSHEMMALAQVNTNMSAAITNHWYGMQSGGLNYYGENVAFGYKRQSPFVGWYDDEKALYDAGKTDFSITGHYQNIVAAKYVVTGFAINTRKVGFYSPTHGQDFSLNYKLGKLNGVDIDPRPNAVSVDTYEVDFLNYYNEVMGELSAAQQAVQDAQAVYDSFQLS